MDITIESTADGSPTLYRADLDEHYHSVKGALTEGKYVYVDMGWGVAAKTFTEEKLSLSINDELRVFEVGFGCGLNAALTSIEARAKRIPTHYYSVELYPLSADIVNPIVKSFYDNLNSELTLVNNAGWETDVSLNPFFTLRKINSDLLTLDLPGNLDVIYFDAFAPEKQPEMWSEDIFRKIYASMRSGGVLTTYCAKGAIRRMLESIGLRCERLPGPPGGKREILRATKH